MSGSHFGDGAFWGRSDWFGTPAYWMEQCSLVPPPSSYRLGEDLSQEVAACLLGGYGMPAEVGRAAFARLRDRGVLTRVPPPSSRDIYSHLAEPLTVGHRRVRYRFAHQRSGRLAACLYVLSQAALPDEPVSLRNALMKLPGIGPKTASWIVRNQTGSDKVAVIDIHVFRACTAAGIFDPKWKLPGNYWECERAFLRFADLGQVSSAALDACMWAQMRELGIHAQQVARAVTRSRAAFATG
jgi:N-glycosylase/DNA lyase